MSAALNSEVPVCGRSSVRAERADETQHNFDDVVTMTTLRRGSPFPCASHEKSPVPCFGVLGIRVDAVKMADAIEQLSAWLHVRDGVTRYVAVTGMHGVAESQDDPYVQKVLNAADLVVPDGMPLVWVGRFYGHPLKRRVCGSELMTTFCQATGNAYRHFFYGGAPGVAEKLARTLQEKYGIQVAGTYTPPFRALNAAEEEELESLVTERAPEVFWVGLSTPKQEKWMYEHRQRLKVPVMLGVGAAFDMNSENLRRAPEWMRNSGLEWLFRLLCEPRRLWKRYLVTIPTAAWLVCIELLRSSKPRPQSDPNIKSPHVNSSGKVSRS
jgi:N-acetylglucosaminyldiphosphoundecaprenol N-acetyl-beta-D-mannosaminyltransferase